MEVVVILKNLMEDVVILKTLMEDVGLLMNLLEDVGLLWIPFILKVWWERTRGLRRMEKGLVWIWMEMARSPWPLHIWCCFTWPSDVQRGH